MQYRKASSLTYWTSKGRVYRSGSGGTYPVNNTDPQCDDEDAPDANDVAEDYADWKLQDEE